MKIIVQKFGGTTMATDESRSIAADKIKDTIKKGYYPVVVVSAMGREGDPYATDTLMRLLKVTGNDISQRDLDMLISCGEIISAVVMAATLNARDIHAVPLNGWQAGIITDDNHGDASVIKINAGNILSYIRDGFVPVVTGFQGITEKGEITTLGRGGSDVSATVLAYALKACMIEVYTDVDGIMTADPDVAVKAKVIDRIDYNEIFQMADSGAKVIHPKAVETAMEHGIPIVIKNAATDSPGTLITNSENNSTSLPLEGKSLLTGIAHIHHRAQVIIEYPEESGYITDDDILDKLARLNISIDLINIFGDKKVFTIDEKDHDRVAGLLLKKKAMFTINKNCSKVTIVGNRIKGVPGVMAKILKTFNQNSIKVYQTADSYATISILVKTEDAEKAVIVLHDEFNL